MANRCRFREQEERGNGDGPWCTYYDNNILAGFRSPILQRPPVQCCKRFPTSNVEGSITWLCSHLKLSRTGNLGKTREPTWRLRT